MSRQLAEAVYFIFIIWLYIKDRKVRPMTSSALWIPLIWLLIVGTKPVSYWIAGEIEYKTIKESSQGSPLDAGVFLFLIIAGLRILIERSLPWREIISVNKWLFVFFLYCLTSVIWSDSPFVLFKRWVKDIGNVVMVLVILSERDYVAAIRAVFARYIYFAIPLSVLFIKYIPELGRYYNHWTWQPVFVGVTDDKNSLGALVFISGLFLIWELTELRTMRAFEVEMASKSQKSSQPEIFGWGKQSSRKVMRNRARFNQPSIASAGNDDHNGQSLATVNWIDIMSFALLLLMVIWLIGQADSSNALVCLFLGIGTLIVIGRSLNRDLLLVRYLGTYFLILAFVIIILLIFPEILGFIFSMLGEDMTLTGRTALWEDLLKEPINRFLGTGYQSFWLGSGVDRIWAKYAFHPNQAHNGYLETYLNGGLIGLFLLIAMILSAGKNLKKGLLSRNRVNIVLFSFFVAAIFYNWSEAMFNKLSPVWFAQLLASMSLSYTPKPQKNKTSHSSNFKYKPKSNIPGN